jgi:hypothetical protein
LVLTDSDPGAISVDESEPTPLAVPGGQWDGSVVEQPFADLLLSDFLALESGDVLLALGPACSLLLPWIQPSFLPGDGRDFSALVGFVSRIPATPSRTGESVIRMTIQMMIAPEPGDPHTPELSPNELLATTEWPHTPLVKLLAFADREPQLSLIFQKERRANLSAVGSSEVTLNLIEWFGGFGFINSEVQNPPWVTSLSSLHGDGPQVSRAKGLS